MKSYDELTNDLLERRDCYVTKQKQKRRTAMTIATSLCCFCMVVLLGFGVWNGGLFSTLPSEQTPEQTIADALYPGIQDIFDDKNDETVTDPAANNKIVINSIAGVSDTDTKMGIALMLNDFVEMTREEMIDYYGINYVPVVPEDITAWKNQSCGIYRRNNGTGEIYWDEDILNYSNEDSTRRVCLHVQKGKNVFVDFWHFEGTEEKSIINNVETVIGLDKTGYYYAKFLYHDVGFLLSAEGVSEDEFVAIIASIIQ